MEKQGRGKRAAKHIGSANEQCELLFTAGRAFYYLSPRSPSGGIRPWKREHENVILAKHKGRGR